ncbi:MAG: glycosyltransferase [Candidatus Brocadiaceae bacterium]|nr:glycosyltransferase [Candidatus Brocadiaceae bacterium]
MSDLVASVVIPVGPGCTSLGRCLDRVLRQEAVRKEIIIVSDPAVPESDLPRGSEELRVMRGRRAGHPGMLINDGMRAARGHVKVLLMPHCVPSGTGWLQGMLDLFEDESVGVVVSQTVPAPETRPGLAACLLDSVRPAIRRNHRDHPVPVETVSHQCDAYRASVLADVGYFDTDHLPHPGEAVDMSIKMADAGFSMVLSDRVVVSRQTPPAGRRLGAALRRALQYGAADAALEKLHDMHWLNAGVHAGAAVSLLLLPVGLLSLPIGVALALLLLVWGAFLALRVPVLGVDVPVMAVNLAVYAAVMLLVREDWAPGLFGKGMHPAIIRQWCLLGSTTASYLLLVARTAGQGAWRTLRLPRGARSALPVFLLGFAWWLLAGVGYMRERLLPSGRGD